MANSSSNPLPTLFQDLSLGESEITSSQSDTPGRKTDFSFSSPQTYLHSSRSPNGSFESSKRSTSSSGIFQFGSTYGIPPSSSAIAGVESFSFQSLSLPPQSQTSTPTSQLQSPFTPVTIARPKLSEALSQSNNTTTSSSFLSPSTPHSKTRPSSSVSPSSDTPSSSHVASPIPEPPAPMIPYDARTEVAPAHALFTDTFQNALLQGSKTAQKVVRAIEKMQAGASRESNSEVGNFLNDSKSLRHFQGTDTRTIAVLGDSGEGKSSLINSLLHFPGVAQTGDIGSACTSVVTEYRQKKAEHTEPITIDVEYLSTPEIRELIKELLWSYRQLFLPGVESDKTSEQDYNNYMRESEQAWSALHAAFKHKRQFTQRMAQDMSEGALERITDQLIKWTEEIEWPAGGVDGFWTSTAQTADECVEQTKFFMQDKFWPFTKIIRVYLDSQVLKTGVVLSDLPGLQDTNLARVRATQDYLIKCDTILIVAKISRAITDQSLKSSLFYVLSRHMPMEWEHSGTQKLNVSVVCTKSDEIDLHTARLEFCGPNNSIPTEIMTQLDSEITNAKQSNDRARKKVAKKQQELLLVQARNRHVQTNLRNVYSSEMNGGNLEVFCVSNKWYEKYCPKGNARFVEASGIPDLRRFCHTVTADAQFNEANHFLKSRLSSLLNTIDLWASSWIQKQDDVEELDDSVHTNVTQLIDQVPSIVKTFQKDFKTCFQEQIMTFFGICQVYDGSVENYTVLIQLHHRSERPALGSGCKSTRLGMDNSQYNAWCLRNGDHQTPKRGHENWNAKIIWKMRMELEGQWDLVEEEVPEAFAAISNRVNDLLNSFKISLHDLLPRRLSDVIIQTVDLQIGNLEYKMSREERKFLTELRAIRRYASESNYNSYILQDMVPVYRSAASQSVQGHIEQGVIFPKMGITMAESMESLIKTTSTKLKVILKGVMATVKTDVDIALRSHSRSRVTLDKVRQERMREFADEIKCLTEGHKLLLQSVEAI
ncbi:unnamed protein product [Fusarium venenatum]|uniref:G domain-containing protein n=1 Tax=Fusarium venenatum TaxID=56646 RepID=A0A2L2SSQ5_9HYPO|nr:uncharacterized protein FVRRES_04660 [Fusarium venenatum]CEI60224.1 unnamed protein product [Fusarium venenatum]